MDHVQIPVGLQPVFMGLDRQRSHQTQAALRVRKHPDDVRPALDLLIEALQHVRRLQVFVVLARQAVERQGLLDRVGTVGILGERQVSALR